MALITLYRTDDGIARLLAQPSVVRGLASPPTVSFSEAPAAYRELFERYREDLTTACRIAELWWEDTVAAQEALGRSREDAIDESFDRRLAGPASHPKVVWIVRAYWMACDDVGLSGPMQAKVAQEQLLLQWLIDAGETELVRLIACMPYWPIGLDENGNWC